MNSTVLNTKNDRTMLLSKCAVCNIKNSKFMKEQEAIGLLFPLGLKTSLNKIPLLGKIIFE